MQKPTNLKDILSQLERIPEISGKLNNKTISSFTNKINEISNALDPLANKLEKIGPILDKLPAKMDKVSNSVKNVEQQTKNTKGLSSFITKMSSLIKIGTIVTGFKLLTDKIGEFVDKSNDYIENLNLFYVTLGKDAEKAKEFTENFSNVLGVDPSKVMRYMATFNSLAKGFGISSDMAYTMSKNLTQLSYDMSSFLNIPIDQAMQKIKSGFSGEIEPMRAVGIALDQATLQQTAYTLGIKKQVSEMTRAQKTQLLYYEMMNNQTSKLMQGDMARTLLQPANALRVLKEQFTLLARAIGNIFIPILTAVIPYIMVLTKWLTAAAQAIANLFGFEIDTSAWGSNLDGISGGIDDITDSATGANKELKKMLAQFDELNVIDFGKDSSSGSGTGSGGLFDIPTYDYDALENAMTKNLDKVEEKLKAILPALETIGLIFGSWKIGSSVVNFLDKIGLIKDLPSTLQKTLGVAILIGSAWLEYQGVKKYLEDGLTIDTIIDLISATGGAFVGTYMLTGNLKIAFAVAVAVGSFNIGLAIGDYIKKEYGDRIDYWIEALDLKIDENNITFPDVAKVIAVLFLSLKDGFERTINKVNEWLKSNPLISSLVETFGGTLLNSFTGGIGGPIAQIVGQFTSFGSQIGQAIGDGFQYYAEGKLGIWIQSIIIKLCLKAISPVTSWLRKNFGTIGQSMADGIESGLKSKQEELQKELEKTVDESGDKATASIENTGKNIGNTTMSAVNQAIQENANGLQSTLEKTTNSSIENSQKSTNEKAYISGGLLMLQYKNAIKDNNISTTETIKSNMSTAISNSQSTINNTAYSAGGLLMNNYKNAIKDNTNSTTETIKSNMSTAISNSQNVIDNAAYSSGGKVALQLGKGIEGNKSLLSSGISKVGKDIGTELGNNISDNMKVNGTTLGRTLNSSLNSSITKIKNNNSGIFGIGGLLANLLNFRFTFFENGGFPDKGQMFIANEAGPELIGNIGKKAAVANNDQIIEGIRQGVAQGVAEAMPNQQQKNPTNIYIGNRKVYSGYGQYANQENNMYGTNVIRV